MIYAIYIYIYIYICKYNELYITSTIFTNTGIIYIYVIGDVTYLSD